ncbi:DNA-processing protein DprA [Patescibacteria group bacterium]|nr:DNA-processing protein DprA [Patescibacteria group bacterium]MBU1952291.1 DNA-processing protein DprA [Patescibacteria group bacterium]
MEKPNEKSKDMLAETTVDNIFTQLEAKKSLEQGEKYWFGISGSWRKTNEEVEESVREAVRKILSRGGGIVSGGALNVDFFATDEALKVDTTGNSIKVYLPVTLERYATHYRKRANEGVITSEQAEMLIDQLTKVKETSPEALIENPDNTEVNQKTYFERNTEVMNASDALVAFQVNDSVGVEDTVQKALEQDKPVRRLKYTIE